MDEGYLGVRITLGTRVFLERMGLSVAKRYGVTSVPKMYLLNPKGEIVAVDLRGEELERKVASFFN